MSVPAPGGRWSRVDAGTCLAFAGLALATRLPFQTRLAYSWDTANFALAARQFDPRLELPHGAGYFLWVQAARLGESLGLSGHRALVLCSMLAGVAGVVLIWSLARAMWDRPTAVAAGLLYLSSPLTWFYAGTAYADLWDATLGTAVAALAWRQRNRPSIACGLLAAVCYGVAAGIRQQNLLFLLPLCIIALLPLGWAARAASALATAAVCSLWGLPLLQAAGGLGGYLARLGEHSHRAFYGYLWTSWHEAVATFGIAAALLTWLFFGCFLVYLSLPFFAWHARRSPGAWRTAFGSRGPLLLLWFLPPILFLLVVHLDVRPGLVLGALPPVILAAAGAATAVRVPAGRFLSEHPAAKLIGIGVVVNLLLFLGARTGVSRAEIVLHDRWLGNEYAAIRQQFAPSDTLLISDRNWYWFSARQAALHLPEYEIWYLDDRTPDRWWSMQGGLTRLLTDRHLPPRVRNLVFIHDHRAHAGGQALEVDADLVRRIPLPGGGSVCWMPVDALWRDLLFSSAWHGPRPRGEVPSPRPGT